MPLLKMDGKEIEIESGTTVLQAAEANGIEIPYYCYHPALEIVGSCRMCLVQVEGMPKLQVSCNTFVGDVPPERKVDGKYDMVVETQNDLVVQERKNILEFLLLNHPLDCPVCDQAGECYLQDYSFKFGNAHSRFDEAKRVRPNEYLGSQIVINHNRCIMCSRCVRFTREISGTSELFVEDRGYGSKIAALEDRPLDNLLAGNVADICPVGALLSTDYIHTNRIWNLNMKNSVCQDCSVGCNVEVYEQNDQVFRVNARENQDVNGYFMCDIGRYGFRRFENLERITSPKIRNEETFTDISWEGAQKEIYDHFSRSQNGKKPKVAGIASPFHTNETFFMFGRLINSVFKDRGIMGSFPGIESEEDIVYPSGFRISKDRSPNNQGMKDLCQGLVDDILTTIKEEKIQYAVILDDGTDRTLDESQNDMLNQLDYLVVLTYAMTPIAEKAHLILPGAAPFEREGTLTNDQGRVQWLRRSCKLQGKSRPDWAILMEIMNTVGKRELAYDSIGDVIKEMGNRFPAYSGISLFKLGDQGLLKNGEMKKD